MIGESPGFGAVRHGRVGEHAPQQQRALSGGAICAAGGAAMGAIVGGNPALRAAVGGAVGTAAGALWEDIHRTRT